MDKQIKAVFLDIDGTFYDHDSNRILPESIKACQLLQKNGIKVALCSGRPKEMAEDLHVFDVIKWDGYIGATGATVMNENNEIIYEKCYTQEQLAQLFSIAEKHNICIFSFGKHEFMTQPLNALSKQMIKEFHLKDIAQRAWNNEKLHSVCALIDENTDIRVFDDIEGITHTSSTRYCIDFIKNDVNKAKGISELMKYWEYEEGEYAAFGDSLNDMEMIRKAAIGIAMGNGDEKLQRNADIICGPSFEPSIYHTLKKLKLI